MRMTLLILCATALVTTSACSPVGRSMKRVANLAHEESVEFDHRVRDWFDSENLAAKAEPQPKQVPSSYCYKTLGDVECYSRPQHGQELRFAGKQTPPPVFAQQMYPAPENVKPPIPVPAIPEPMGISDVKHEVVNVAGQGVVPQKPLAVEPTIPDYEMQFVQDGNIVYEVPKEGSIEMKDVPEYKQPRSIPSPF